MKRFKDFIKKYAWLITVLAIIVIFILVFIGLRIREPNDGMFYEVKCTYPNESASYSLVVDDKKSAVEFRKEILNGTSETGEQATCDFITYERATDDILFMYAVTTVLNDVTFAFKEQSVYDDSYRVLYYDAEDNVAAMSCQYQTERFNCYNNLPTVTCPKTLDEAKKILTDRCDYKKV